MKILALTLALFFATAAFPQSANVIELAPDDALKAKTAYDNLQKAQTEYDVMRQHISDKYVTGQTIAPHGYGVPEWANGFEFSKDFRFIVPKTQPEQKSNCSSNYYGWNNYYGCLTINPAINAAPILQLNCGTSSICAN